MNLDFLIIITIAYKLNINYYISINNIFILKFHLE